MPSTYGTIPTAASSSSSAAAAILAHGQTLMNPLRPWRDLFDPTAFSRPYHYHEALTRLRTNLYHFRVNYTLIALLILFLSLIYHPISMITFLLIFGLWIFLYFNRNGPIFVLRREVDDRVVLGALSGITVFGLVFTGVGTNVLVALGIGFVLVGVHAVFRTKDDLFLDESEAGEEGLLKSVVGGSPMRTYGGVV